MSGRLPQGFIDDLLDRVDIVEVIDSRVKLKRTGKNYSACCPFHDEKTPSFTVSPDKQFYYCFGCGASGNTLGFVMDYDRVSFREAAESLAQRAGLQIPETREKSAKAAAEEQRRKDIYRVLEQASEFFQAQLRKSSARLQAAEYLRNRGLNAEVAQEYRLGLAPPGWDNLLNQLKASNKSWGEEKVSKIAVAAGLAIQNPESGRVYDRFRERIIFPIVNTRGRVIGFGGRQLDTSAASKKQPKYLNSPETPVFHKGKELYGLWHAKKKLAKIPRLLVVEGYMDVVALAQFGLPYSVATLGTACGEDHLALAFKNTNQVVFCFDGDKAGRKAAERALTSALPAMDDGREVKFLFLPEGEDPDTLVRMVGPEKFEQLIEQAIALEDFLFDSVSTDLNTATMEGRAAMSKRAAPLIQQLPKGVYRELMFEQLAKRTELSRETIVELTDTPTPSTQPQEPAPHLAPSAFKPGPLKSSSEHQVGFAAKAKTGAADNGYYQNQGEQPRWRQGSNSRTEYRPQQPQQIAHSNLFKLTPERRLCALLLQHPELARLELPALPIRTDADGDISDPDLKRWQTMFELLQSRPNYTINRILGYWRAAHGASDTEALAALVAEDMLASHKLAYDPEAELRGCLAQVTKRIEQRQRQAELAQLRQVSTQQMSADQRRALVEKILRTKKIEQADNQPDTRAD
jgi:DNA primase